MASAKDPWTRETRSSWLNCALRVDEAAFWVSIWHYEAVAVGNWWYCVSRGHLCLYILHKVEIWTGVTDAWLTDRLTTLKNRATQLLIKYKSGALVTQKSIFNALPRCHLCTFIWNCRGFKQDCPTGELYKEKIIEMYSLILPSGNAQVFYDLRNAFFCILCETGVCRSDFPNIRQRWERKHWLQGELKIKKLLLSKKEGNHKKKWFWGDITL